MENNEFRIICTSIWDTTKIVERYPILKKYKSRIEYPYENKEIGILIVAVPDLKKFVSDVEQEIVIYKDDGGAYCWVLEIYDDYRE